MSEREGDRASGREPDDRGPGETVLDQAHDWQERVFDRLADGWSEGRRQEFRLAMSELMQRSDEVDVRRA